MQPNKPTGPVMDIQRPAPQPASPPRPPMPAIDTMATQQPATQLTRPATREYTRPRPEDPTAPSFTPATDPARMAPAVAEPVKPKKSKKGWLIAVVIFVLIGVIGGAAAYYFLVMNKEEAAVTQQPVQTQSTQEEAKVEATPEGVDTATNAIDKSLNSVNDDADFPSDQLTDTSLGL
jgi:hypothetical protein